MSTRKYEIFLKTVDLGSLTRASEVLGYTQSAISHIISGLEDELGMKLLIRGRSGVRLTEDGKRLLPAFRSVCRENQELLRQVSEVHGLEVGTIRIGSIFSVSIHILPDVLKGFSRQHLNIEYEILQGNYDDIEQWILDGRVDCGFLRFPTPDTMESFLIMREHFLAIFPADRQLPPGPFPFEKIKEEPYILRPDTLNGELSKVLKKDAYRPMITYSAKDDYAIMAMVERGLGISILAELLMKDSYYHIQKRQLDPPVFREICLSYKSIQTLSPAARHFVQYIKNNFVRPNP